MPRSALLYLALAPLLPVLLYLALPGQYRESYAYWSSDDLNRDGRAIVNDKSWSSSSAPEAGARGERVKTWRNMGFWRDTDDYTVAAEALARELMTFAGAASASGGRVIVAIQRVPVERDKGGSLQNFVSAPRADQADIGHGSGESLLLHLQSKPPPAHLHALTSLASETRQSQALLTDYLDSLPADDPTRRTSIAFFTTSAVPAGAGETEHPLHPMRGFMGEESSRSASGHRAGDDDDEYEDDVTEGRLMEEDLELGGSPAGSRDTEPLAASPKAAPPPYDLIHSLDAAYHFPPSITAFQAAAFRHLAPGGVLAYTDVLPPLTLSSVFARVLAVTLSVPLPNLLDRPYGTARAYETDLHDRGYECVRVQDWTEHVLPGFGRNLRKRAGKWRWVGKMVGRAEEDGWKVVAVKIGKVDDEGQCPASFA